MARGKYAKIIDSLPRMLGTEPKCQLKVEAVKDELRRDPNFALEATALASAYAALRARKETIEESLSAVNLELEAVTQLMTDQFEAQGVDAIRTPEYSVSMHLEPYAQVVDKEAFRRWCIAEGLEHQMTLPWQTTNSITKARRLEGEPDPPGVECFQKVKIRLGE